MQEIVKKRQMLQKNAFCGFFDTPLNRRGGCTELRGGEGWDCEVVAEGGKRDIQHYAG